MRNLCAIWLLVLTACPKSEPTSGCSTATCAGCCDNNGVCQLGQSSPACGSGGDQCTPCGSGLSCVQGVCTPGGTGGSSGAGGGSSGTGGGTSGTGGSGAGTGSSGAGVATNDQELVSGTRLRAIDFAGDDGSRAPFSTMFWDNTLSTYCVVSSAPFAVTTPTLPFGNFRCYPLVLAYESGVTSDGPYGDPACTQSTVSLGFFSLYQDLFIDAGLPAGNVFYLSADGGFANAIQSGTAYSKLDDGGCQVFGNAYVAGTPVPVSSFARMALHRE